MKYWLFAGYLLLASLPLRAQLDVTFSNDGKASVIAGQRLGLGNMLVQPADQKILLGGVDRSTNVVLSRFLSTTGGLDPAFGGGGGVVTFTFGTLMPAVRFGIQSSGKIIVMMNLDMNESADHLAALVRLNSDGSMDGSFSTSYVAVPQAGYATTMTIQPDDKIVIAGMGGSGLLVTRLSKDGVYVTKWSGGDASSWAIAQQKDGKILTAGTTVGTMFAVSRYTNPIRLPTLPHMASADSAAVTGVDRAMLGDGVGSGTAAIGVRIFPNPATSTLRVQGLDARGSTLLVVRDASGKTMMNAKVELQSEYTLDVQRLAAGTYFLQLITGGKQANFPFVKAP